jgi:transposase
MTRPGQFSPEVRERAVRMVVEQWAAIVSIAEKIGCMAETLRKWVRQAERDQGRRPGMPNQIQTPNGAGGAHHAGRPSGWRDAE